MCRPHSLAAYAALILATLLVICAGCGGGGDTEQPAAKNSVKTIKAGELTVGADIPFPPFELGRPPDYDGFDIDLARAVATRLGLKLVIQKTPFDTAFRDLNQGRFDMVASTVTITPERQQAVDFSQPYFEADQSLMVKKGSGIHSLADLDGKRVGAQLGTTGADFARKKTKATVQTYDLIDDAFQALETGQVDGVINDFPVSQYATRAKPDLEVVQRLSTGERYGLVFAKGNTQLRDAVNKAVTALKKDGTYADIYRKWLDADPPASILSATG
jgi:polar amino acid transport system substrate-binding protein